MPSPGAAEDAIEIGHPSMPAEGFARPADIGDQHRRIARSARHLPARDAPAGDALGSGDHFAHAVPGAGAEIERQAGPTTEQMVERREMRLGEVLDVDVITHGSAIGRIVIGAVDAA